MEKINKVQACHLPHLLASYGQLKAPGRPSVEKGCWHRKLGCAGGEKRWQDAPVQPNTIDVLTPGGQVMLSGIPYLHFHHCRECSLFPAAGQQAGIIRFN